MKASTISKPTRSHRAPTTPLCDLSHSATGKCDRLDRRGRWTPYDRPQVMGRIPDSHTKPQVDTVVGHIPGADALFKRSWQEREVEHEVRNRESEEWESSNNGEKILALTSAEILPAGSCASGESQTRQIKPLPVPIQSRRRTPPCLADNNEIESEKTEVLIPPMRSSSSTPIQSTSTSLTLGVVIESGFDPLRWLNGSWVDNGDQYSCIGLDAAQETARYETGSHKETLVADYEYSYEELLSSQPIDETWDAVNLQSEVSISTYSSLNHFDDFRIYAPALKDTDTTELFYKASSDLRERRRVQLLADEERIRDLDISRPGEDLYEDILPDYRDQRPIKGLPKRKQQSPAVSDSAAATTPDTTESYDFEDILATYYSLPIEMTDTTPAVIVTPPSPIVTPYTPPHLHVEFLQPDLLMPPRPPHQHHARQMTQAPVDLEDLEDVIDTSDDYDDSDGEEVEDPGYTFDDYNELADDEQVYYGYGEDRAISPLRF